MKTYLYSLVIFFSVWHSPVGLSQSKHTIAFDFIHQQADSIPASSPKPTAKHKPFTKHWYATKSVKTLAVPTLLMGYGLSSFGNQGFPYSSQEAFRDRNRYFANFHTHIDDVTWALPIAGVYGLNAMGVKGKHNFSDRTALYLLSATLANSVSLGLKSSTDRTRPDLSANNSFPSGHTTNAFVAAEFMHQEYKEESVWYSVAGYSAATATGAMRILNNRHWLTDVLVGAGVGMLSTKIMYLLYPLIEQRAVGKTSQVGIVPTYNEQTFGVAMVYILQ
jgi:membrane-associated phospholipid phosphatase